MTVQWKQADDVSRIRERVAGTSNAKQRDRYRVVLLAGEGLGERRELSRDQIAATVGRSRQFVDEWVRRYRRGGLEALKPGRSPGRPPKLNAQQQRELCRMLEAGPSAEEGISAYNGPILREKIEQCFGTTYSLDAVYKLLHRLGYNDLMPRPTHPDTNPAALEAFKKKSCPNNWSGSRRPTPIGVS